MSNASVNEAAEVLGVSPRRVRQMLAEGAIAGGRVGRSWVVDRDRLPDADRRRPGRGRPWSPASAWAVLALADGKNPSVSAVDRSRARKRLRQGLAGLERQLSVRAERQSFYAHPSVLARLGMDARVVRSGSSAAAEHGADLVAQDQMEGYVRSSAVDELIEDYGLDAAADRPNVLLRVVEPHVWPFDGGDRVAGRSVVGMDLLDADDPRARRAGLGLVELP